MSFQLFKKIISEVDKRRLDGRKLHGLEALWEKSDKRRSLKKPDGATGGRIKIKNVCSFTRSRRIVCENEKCESLQIIEKKKKALYEDFRNQVTRERFCWENVRAR